MNKSPFFSYQGLVDAKNSLSCVTMNAKAFLKGYSVRFSYDRAICSYVASEKLKKCYFINRKRGHRLYKNGIVNRGEFIFNSYRLNNISFKPGDVVIDCGANSGDLHLELQVREPGISYIGIEPNPDDFKSLARNVSLSNKTLLNLALGEQDGVLPFYVYTEKGDSSIVEPPVYTHKISVDVVRLDKVFVDINIDRVKLLKLEAEGYEIEILRGASGLLDRIEYIAVDGGYERGKDKEQTFTWMTNFLILNGFEIIDIYFPWCRALFRRRET